MPSYPQRDFLQESKMQARMCSPIRISRQSVFRDESARDFRLMIEGVRSDDLEMANGAFSRMELRMGADSESGDTLSRIGMSLDRGDLEAAREDLEVLEGKALQVLRGLRDRTQSRSTRAGRRLV